MTTVEYWIAESDIIHDSSFQNIFPNKQVYIMGSFHLAKQLVFCSIFGCSLFVFFVFWPLYYRFLFNLQLLMSPFISANVFLQSSWHYFNWKLLKHSDVAVRSVNFQYFLCLFLQVAWQVNMVSIVTTTVLHVPTGYVTDRTDKYHTGIYTDYNKAYSIWEYQISLFRIIKILYFSKLWY
jgi:hypothetical protein